ncbi:MAG: phosphate ABC transporter substrate-binding protein PstS [Terriglobia bacterium]
MKKLSNLAIILVSAALVLTSLVAFHSSPSNAAPVPTPDTVMLNGAGATFPYPIYSKWFSDYNKIHSDIQINYQSIGSGAGIRQLLSGTVDFGASDVPMNDEQLGQSKTKILHFPTVLGAVVPTYNIAGVSQELNFTGEVLTDIFLGKITKWNDPEIAKYNKGVNLPAQDIVVVHRSEGSGTSYVWTDFLSKVSTQWGSKVGRNTAVNWPVGLGGKGNEGVAGLVKQIPGALGYVELIYAVQNQIPYGRVRNAAGVFVKGDLAGVTAAAGGYAKTMPEDFRISITNAPGQAAYPIASFTYLLIPTKIEDANKKDIIKRFLTWMLNDGQEEVEALSYARLPKEVVARELKQISQIQ